MRGHGGGVVGMTSVPEVVLAKELGICFASVGLVVNMATGVETGPIKLDTSDSKLNKNIEFVNNLFLDIFSNKLDQKICDCVDSIVYL